MMSRMRRVRARLAEYHSVDRLRMAGVDVFFGEARFVGSKALAVGDARLAFKRALIATGARPNASSIPGLEDIGYLTSETIFDLEALPERLAIIGGGPLGCEMAQAFCRMGSRVILLQDDPKFDPAKKGMPPSFCPCRCRGHGVETRLNTTVTAAHMEGGDKLLETINNEIQSSVTVMRSSSASDVYQTWEGCVSTSPPFTWTSRKALPSTISSVRQIPMSARPATSAWSINSTNVAEVTGRMAVENAFAGRRSRQSLLMVPRCTFCDPEIAHIGLHVWDARERGIPCPDDHDHDAGRRPSHRGRTRSWLR